MAITQNSANIENQKSTWFGDTAESLPDPAALNGATEGYYIQDDTGTIFRYVGGTSWQLDSVGGPQSGRDINLAAAIGAETSANVYLSSVNKFGKALDVDSAVSTDVWDGADGTTSTDEWVPPTTARTHDIVSTDANDDGSPAGTGAHTVEVQGLDTNWNPQTETVTLNGTTNVATANTYLRIFRMKVMACGSGGGNAGIITATAQTDATVTAAIQAGNNQTLMAIYTVPNNMTAYITSYYASFIGNTPATTTGNVRLLVADTQATGAPFQLKHIQGIVGGDRIAHEFRPYFKVSEKHDIKLNMSDCSADNSVLDGGFDIILRREA